MADGGERSYFMSQDLLLLMHNQRVHLSSCPSSDWHDHPHAMCSHPLASHFACHLCDLTGTLYVSPQASIRLSELSV